jgi:hypothetical protein
MYRSGPHETGRHISHQGSRNATQVSVRCSTASGGLLDGRVADVDDLIDARDYATRVARSLIAIPNSRDWRECCLSVVDDLGNELLEIPFASIIGKSH